MPATVRSPSLLSRAWRAPTYSFILALWEGAMPPTIAASALQPGGTIPPSAPYLWAMSNSPHSNTPTRWKGNKSSLPSKPCAVCGRTMTWRRAWARNWDAVLYCSDPCRKKRSHRAGEAGASHTRTEPAGAESSATLNTDKRNDKRHER